MILYFSKMVPSRRKQHLMANYPLPQIAAEQNDLNMRILSASVLSSVLGFYKQP